MADITTLEDLRARMGNALPMTQAKIYDSLFDEATRFIARTPLIFMATTSKDGMPTVSPKGDGPGFIEIVDDKTLLIPERPGNRLLHGLSNIIETGTVGLIFVVPGQEETLRITGRCTIKDDEELCARLKGHNDKPALLALQVDIETCFFHCAKAFKRSGTWAHDSWSAPEKIRFGEIIARKTAKGKVAQMALKKGIDAAVAVDYKTNL